ncbi:hypothetical protein EMPG_17230 [Blastomyces silverae]|uniref:Uncharacterized protein n=1 Tax=Blastomyces silverae TaxID=2060906 RepID=A0A0H1B865_9EURO|nr:hypothetical protein EMPG_17230 [Blastomyces silverae]
MSGVNQISKHCAKSRITRNSSAQAGKDGATTMISRLNYVFQQCSTSGTLSLGPRTSPKYVEFAPYPDTLSTFKKEPQDVTVVLYSMPCIAIIMPGIFGLTVIKDDAEMELWL